MGGRFLWSNYHKNYWRVEYWKLKTEIEQLQKEVNEMDIEAIKQMAIDINNVAAASYQSGKEYIEQPLLAKIERMRMLAVQGQRICTCPARHLFDEIQEIGEGETQNAKL